MCRPRTFGLGKSAAEGAALCLKNAPGNRPVVMVTQAGSHPFGMEGIIVIVVIKFRLSQSTKDLFQGLALAYCKLQRIMNIYFFKKCTT